jgi:DNA-binding Lrp family transcriptional regulator
MGTEMLSYSQLGDRLNCSPEAARSLVKRLRCPSI